MEHEPDPALKRSLLDLQSLLSNILADNPCTCGACLLCEQAKQWLEQINEVLGPLPLGYISIDADGTMFFWISRPNWNQSARAWLGDDEACIQLPGSAADYNLPTGVLAPLRLETALGETIPEQMIDLGAITHDDRMAF